MRVAGAIVVVMLFVAAAAGRDDDDDDDDYNCGLGENGKDDDCDGEVFKLFVYIFVLTSWIPDCKTGKYQVKKKHQSPCKVRLSAVNLLQLT